MMKICLIAVMIVLALIAVDITVRIGWDRFISGIGSLVDGQRHAEQLPKQSADIKNTSTDRAETPKQPAQPLPGALPWPGEQAEQQAPRRAGDWWRILTDPRHPDAWSCQNWSGGPGDAMRRADLENRLYRMDDVEEDGQVGPAGAFAQEVTVLPLNVSKSEDEIRHGMIIGTRFFNENLNIRLFQPYLWLKYPCLSSKNSWSQNGRLLPHFQLVCPF